MHKKRIKLKKKTIILICSIIGLILLSFLFKLLQRDTEYLKLDDIGNKEIYNINKAIELKLVNEDTKYNKYLAITCGFKMKKN